MKRIAPALVVPALAAILLSSSPAPAARAADWTDIQGKTLKGEPVQVLGQFVIFSEKPTVSRCMPAQSLPLNELARFIAAVKDRAPRASDWAHATGALATELRGHLEKMDQQKLVPNVVDARPEPALVVVLFLNKDAGDTWKLFWGSMEPMAKLGQLEPGVLECVGYGVNYGPSSWLELVKGSSAPWSLVKLDDQPLLKTLDPFVPRTGYRAVLFDRHGVPLFASVNPDEDAVKEFWKQVAGFIAKLDLSSPFSWRSQAYLRTAEQIVAHPTGRVEPELIGYAIRPGSLARVNVKAFDASLKISADGVVSDVRDLKAEAPLPPKLHEAIVTTLKKAVFVPALENGQPVASEFVYRFRDGSESAAK